MRVVRIDLEYDGAGFRGFAPQPGVRTVGGELQSALTRLVGEVRLSAGGRTDAGVHALGQVVSFATDAPRPVGELQRALNAVLGEDLYVRTVMEVDEGIDARRSARRRRYGHAIWNSSRPNIWERHLMWHIDDPLDVMAMAEACEVLVGRHDFAAFRTHRSQDDHEITTTRRVQTAKWYRDEARAEVVRFEIEADAFLRHMVRTVVGSGVRVGLGKQPRDSIARMLAAGERASAGPTAPAHGLTLLGVTYDDGIPAPATSEPDRRSSAEGELN